jgi:hypothetical protein
MRQFWIGFFVLMLIGAAVALIYADWMGGPDDALVEGAPAHER